MLGALLHYINAALSNNLDFIDVMIKQFLVPIERIQLNLL